MAYGRLTTTLHAACWSWRNRWSNPRRRPGAQGAEDKAEPRHHRAIADCGRGTDVAQGEAGCRMPRPRQGRDPAGLVFTTIDGTPLRPDGVTWRFARIVKLAGVKRISFHGLRHTHATDLLRAGVHPKIASERLGHSSVAVTYGHLLARAPWLARRCRPSYRRRAARGAFGLLGWQIGGK